MSSWRMHKLSLSLSFSPLVAGNSDSKGAKPTALCCLHCYLARPFEREQFHIIQWPPKLEPRSAVEFGRRQG